MTQGCLIDSLCSNEQKLILRGLSDELSALDAAIEKCITSLALLPTSQEKDTSRWELGADTGFFEGPIQCLTISNMKSRN